MATIAVAALLLVAATPLPQLTPTTSKAAHKVERAGVSQTEPATAQGYPNNPATPTVNLTKTPNADEVAQHTTNNRGQPATPDWITLFTGVLATVAVLQFLAMMAQAFYMRH